MTSRSEATNDMLAGQDVGALLSQLRYPTGAIGHAIGDMMERVERHTDRLSNPANPQPPREFFLVQTSHM